jgi:ubiquinone/menaquinone biosynthesis C-methylase UbiE
MSIRLRSITPALALAVASLMAARVASQTQAPERPRSKPGTDRPSEINKPFQNPDVSEYLKRFESDSREVYAQREAIVKALALRPDMAVADIGAGTGLFTRLIADRVGPKGRVYAVDISPAFLKYIADEAKRRKQPQIQTVLGTQEVTNLPAGAVDVAFLCDTYHHLEHPETLLASIHRALRPGGRLVMVEFDRSRPVSSDFVKKHVRADKKQFLSEIAAAGFTPIPVRDAPQMKENFFAEFRRVEQLKSMP